VVAKSGESLRIAEVAAVVFATMKASVELLGESAEISALRQQVERLLTRHSSARRPAPVLIEGETGTGKGLLARVLHQGGPRAGHPFVHVDCAAIPDTMLEAELFGYERGAFTDARQSKPGLFQVAHQGVIFLDEVGLLPAALQAKLLTVIEEQAVRRLGSVKREAVDVLVVSATNEDLAASVRERRFRADLYHRLSVLKLVLPPLRARTGDALFLAERFLRNVCGDYGLPSLRLSEDARQALASYPWPGNVRELSNVIERAALLADSSVVTADALGLPRVAGETVATAATAPQTGRARRSDADRARVVDALEQSGWNISRAAAALGVPRHVLRYRIQKYGLAPGESVAPDTALPVTLTPRGEPSESRVPAAPTVRWQRRRATLARIEFTSGRADTLIEKTRAFGGQIEELNAGSFIAAFGLDAAEDAARRAALAAIALQRLAARLGPHTADPTVIRIALHSQHVMTAHVEGRTQIEGSARRRMLEVLESIVSASRPNGIVLSDETKALLDRRFDCSELGGGDRAAPHAHELINYQPTAFGSEGRAAVFVGRGEEIELLRSRFAAVVAGSGCAIGIVGEAGVGKSRLAFELRRALTDGDFTYLEGRCEPYGTGIPYFAAISLLRDYFGIDERDDPAAARHKVAARLRAAGPALEAAAAPFLALLDILDEDREWTALGPAQRRQRTIDALKRLLTHEGEARPLLLLFEDLHWVDSETEAVLQSLALALPNARVLLLITYRPEYQPGWLGRGHLTELRLDALAPSSAATLLRTLTGDDPSLRGLHKVLIDRTEGNPLFLEESVRALVETRALTGERGAYRLERSPATLPVPRTVEAVLAARVDRLPVDAKRVLEAAAVIGNDIPFQILHAVCEGDATDLRRTIDTLQAAELVYERSLWPDVEYTFKHSLTHEVTYDALLDDQRRALHARVVDATERLYGDRLAEHVDRLADHSVKAELWDKAAAYLRLAGTKAFAQSAHRAAAGRFEQALAALGRLPRDRDTIASMIDAKLALRNTLLSVGEVDTVLQHLSDASALCDAIGDRDRAAWICAYMSTALWGTGRYTDAVETTLQTQRLAAEIDNSQLRVYSDMALSLIYHSMGRYSDGVVAGTRAAEALSGERLLERFNIPSLPSVAARTWLVSCLAELGEFARAAPLAREALEVAREVDEPWTLVNAYLGLGILHLREGRTEAAVQPLDEGLEICRRSNVDVWLGPLALLRGHVAMLEGRLDDALAFLARGLEQVTASRLRFYHSVGVIWTSEAKLRAGDLDEARRLAEQALRDCERFGERGNEAYALRLLGDVESRGAIAEDWYLRALARAELLQMRPLTAQCHLSLGRWAAERDRPAIAAEHLSAAITVFEQLGMEGFVSAATAERQRFLD
jgi:transcriptional regulator with GAF, ATPase, and Fis domain/tetratricopeptide (TPR) repeat protein